MRSALRTAGDREASDAADAEVVAWLVDNPDGSLEHDHWVNEALFTGEFTIPEAQDAYAYYERIGDGMGMVRAMELELNGNAGRGDFVEALEILERAISLAARIGRPERAAGFSAAAAYIFPDSPVPIPEALDRCRRYLDMAGHNRVSAAMILLNLGVLEASTGVPDEWRHHFEAVKVIIDDLGLVLPLGAALYPTFLGDAELAAGEPTRTVELLRSSCSTLERLGERPILASLAPLTAMTLLAVGRLDEVEHYAFWGRDIASPWDLDANVRWRIAVSGLRARQGRHGEAIALARESVALLATSGFLVTRGIANMTLAGALRAAGDEPAAMAAAQEAQRLATAKQDISALRKIEAFLRG